MWMMGYNDGGEFNHPDSFAGRKFRPLIPRPSSAISSPAGANTPCLGRIHDAADLLALNHHLAMVEQNKREFNTQQVVVSSRWNPTPEQLQTLEELYRRGTRTPSADQIQHITAQLRRYGKIEGKNVFYWFQNHKARERQKRRRQLESSASNEQYHCVENIERKDSGGGANRTGYEVEQNKNWAPPTNCSTLASAAAAEKTTASSIQRAAAVTAECRTTDGWLQFDERELQHRRNLEERNATWHMIPLSSSSSSPTTTTTTPVLPPQLIKPQNLNIFITPYRENPNPNPNHSLSFSGDYNESEFGESQTLQLFPLRSGCHRNETAVNAAEKLAAVDGMSVNFTPPYQFFEFLPLKN